jgi:hypothetical protein
MTTTERDAIGSPRDGLAIYNVTLDTLDLRANGAWVSLGTGSGTVTGSGAAGRVGYWTGTSALSGEDAFYYDSTNNRVGIGTTAPSAALDVRGGAIKLERTANGGEIYFVNGTSSDNAHRIYADASGRTIIDHTGANVGLKVFNAGAEVVAADDRGITVAATAMFRLADSNNGIDLSQTYFTAKDFSGRFYFRNTGSSTNQAFLRDGLLRIGDGTAPVARLDIAGQGTTSSTFGIKVFNATPDLIFAVRDDRAVGVNVDPADATFQVKGLGTTTAKSLLVENSSGTDNFYVQDNGLITGQAFQNNTTAPTISYASGAGTGPTTDILVGGNNGVLFLFTTGTSPSASDTVFTMNLNKSFANGCAASWVAYNAATQPIIGNFWLSASGNNSITVKYAGTLAASTQYGLSITIMGY